MKLFFDTETSGKINNKLPITDPSQPRLVQLALILTTDDCEEISHAKLLVKPNGFEIPKEATAVHGISTEFANKYGLPLKTVLALFYRSAELADSLIAFNIQFDSFILRKEMPELKCDYKFKDKEFCEMLAMKDVCKLEGKYNDYKWPTLTEAHKFAFASEFDKAHDALADVKAMIRIHKWRITQK